MISCHLNGQRLPDNLSIECLGFVQNLDAYWREANVFVYHSTHDGTPNVILEAQRWSLPSLLNRYPAFENIVEEDVSGLIYDDEQDFLRKLRSLLQDISLRNKLAAGGAQAHQEIYSMDTAGALWEEALRRAINCQN